MRVGAAVVLLVALTVTACGGAETDERVAAPEPRDARQFVAQLDALHPNAFHTTSRAQFQAAAESLDRRLTGLARDRTLVELMRLTALTGDRDGHTGIFPLDPGHRRQLHLFPLRLYAFPEGLSVVGEIGRLGAVGSRVVAIGGVPVGRIAGAVRPLVPADNDASRAARLAQWLVVAEVLRGLGFALRSGPVAFTLSRPGGGTRTLRLAAVPAARWKAAWTDLWHPMVPQGLPRRPRPAYLARRDDDAWTALLDRGRAAYVAYNVTLGDSTALARQLARLAGRRGVTRVVVDLRHNPGGNNGAYGPLISTLRRLARTEQIVVLTSRTTFSAAANLLADLESTTRFRIVGEATGGSPNLFGDPAAFRLGTTGWQANVATVWWEKSRKGDPRVAFEPHLPVPLTAAAFFAGRDPVLQAALR